MREIIAKKIKQNRISWSKILSEVNYSNTENLNLIFPVYISRDKCSTSKLTGSQCWEVFNELLVNGNSEVIILGSMSLYMND
ncbi:hypothetical protein SanaruYs_10380 [Chryseotalea sanaruensis]|uniref:Uncharacterized protein n=1 Tax=Chryseotalea sanaruensis TaxID=2482724 RepID=A0A401U7F8_9BACT|nr:hypothetical protein SanaruYs_10380 [Chryseotalea sanaruensis]